MHDETKHCKKCDQTKPLDQFAEFRNKGATYRRGACIDCKREADRAYVASHHPEVRARVRKWQRDNREMVNRRSRERYRASVDKATTSQV